MAKITGTVRGTYRGKEAYIKVEADAYTDTKYGADADGNRGRTEHFIEDITPIEAEYDISDTITEFLPKEELEFLEFNEDDIQWDEEDDPRDYSPDDEMDRRDDDRETTGLFGNRGGDDD